MTNEGAVMTIDEQLLKDNKAMREVGGELAERAMYVVNNYDGLHRLSIAIAKWCNVIANEGLRDSLYKKEEQS